VISSLETSRVDPVMGHRGPQHNTLKYLCSCIFFIHLYFICNGCLNPRAYLNAIESAKNMLEVLFVSVLMEPMISSHKRRVY
jgi:hypothetical protein